ncbi:hypothetical protein A2Y85_01600 [candidate division WOR-3 bacterium RBG_13_43_14]|uniref:RNA-binding protein AU-1/Ribonuclease E/G domain-containing protein n=1 Tax=candidate division WOR-3 bacterium RBG_13_43_14 TaxID=1802590 RepID=A0A1F4UBY6_UNCW3|nr:MAG: hypothetical protein A2Y85_01600 [candidate division WOR-3 bacterium RBG_13_43_14]
MTKKDIVINVSNVETRIAFLEEGKLYEYYFEQPAQSSLVGNVYRAKVLNLISGLKAAFVNIGYERNGFLPLNEIPFEEFSDIFESEVEVEHGYRPEEIKLRKDQETLVQVTKDSYGVKGPRMTSYISIPGRYVVLLINAKNIGVSRKIRNRREREDLFKIGKKIKPQGMGLIIRTAAARAHHDEIKREVEYLTKNWQQNLRTIKDPAPALIYREPDTLIKTVRDLFNNEVRNLYIDSDPSYRKIINYLGVVSPRMRSRVKLDSDPLPIFQKFNIEEQLKELQDRRVWLKSGGYIVIDHTEALVSIDVNTGKSSKEKQAEKLALSTNIEALTEIARQLRLRDIGGLVVVDLIDLERRENINRMLREFRTLIRDDRARYRIGGMSDFGLFLFTRERSRASVTHTLSEVCPVCKGKGRITNRQSTLGHLERWFANNGTSIRGKMVEVRTSPRFADFLSLHHAETLSKLSKEYSLILRLKGDYSINEGDFKVVVV